MNELISDKEISERYNTMAVSFDFEYHPTKSSLRSFSSYRDELFCRLITGWNIERVKAGFKPLSKARLASALAKNPHLRPYDDEGNETNNDEDLFTLINECEKKGNYKKAHFVLFGSKKKK